MVHADGRFQAVSVKTNKRGNALQCKAEARSSNSCCHRKATCFI